MKTVFVHRNALLRDSHLSPEEPGEKWRLMPTTIEAMRLLATEDTLILVYGQLSPRTDDGADGDGTDPILHELVRQVEAGGGRVDGLVVCPHAEADTCRCWGDVPGLIWAPAIELNLRPEETYVIGDQERDVSTAYAAGARPIAVLCERSIGAVFGELPSHKDFPIAPDLITAVGYIGQEEETRQRLNAPRVPPRPLPAPEAFYSQPESLPRVTILSRAARGRQSEIMRARVQLRDIGRWLSFFSLGAVGLSLGIAYLLTHLYRMQPFPPIVYYITLQFIPRPLRGALFILWGTVVILLAIRSFYRSSSRWRKRRPG